MSEQEYQAFIDKLLQCAGVSAFAKGVDVLDADAYSFVSPTIVFPYASKLSPSGRKAIVERLMERADIQEILSKAA